MEAVSKSNRKLFGVTGAPQEATEVYVRPMPFDHDGTGETRKVETRSWVLVNSQTGKLVRANSYDGNLGKGFNAADFMEDLPKEAKDLQKKLKGYSKATAEEIAGAKWLKVLELAVA